MTPAARLQAAMDVLERWMDGVPAERALTAWARGARYAGSKDRRAVRDHVYDLLRRKGNCAHSGQGETPRALILGLARLQGTDASHFSGDGYGPEPLTEVEAQLFATPADVDPSRDTPQWLRERLVESHDQWPEIEAAMAARAPVYLRVNVSKTSRAEAKAALAAEDIVTEEAAAQTALMVTSGAPRIAGSEAYREGLVELQDLSPQLACAHVDWPKGKVLDFCAGGGGKALAIAAATGARVFLHDANASRMADLPERAARAGADLQIVDQAKGTFDLVLVDVPCSGSGTWRRDPEAKWRLSADALDRLKTVQSDILDQTSALTDRVVYMTCSLLDEENGNQINAFLRRNPGWSCRSQRLWTPLDGSDGFFMAELECAK